METRLLHFNIEYSSYSGDAEHRTPMTEDDNLAMLKAFGAKLLTWLESVKEECGIAEYGEIIYQVGNEGFHGDAYVGGGYQAVDLDAPSYVEVPIKAEDIKNIVKLKDKSEKLLSEWEDTIHPDLCFYCKWSGEAVCLLRENEY